MASDDFSATNSPLASPWTGFGGSFGGMRSVSGGCRNVAGSDGDAGAYYSSSSATESQVDYVSGTTDGGPALHMGPGPDGYVDTAYDGAIIYAFRLDDGSYSSELGHATGVYVAGQPVKKRRSGSNLITSVSGVDILTVTDNTYTGGSPGIFGYAGNFIVDNWTDNAGGTAYSLTMDSGSYALTGQSAGLRAARRMTAAAGSYALSGQVALVRLGRKLVAEAGSYVLTGQDVTLEGPTVGYSLTMDAGSYTLTGSDAAADYAITLQSGSYGLTGNAVGLTRSGRVLAEQGTYALSGQALAIRVDRVLQLASGSYSLTGNDVGLDQHDPSTSLSLETGIYTLSGQQVSLFGPGDSNADIFRNLPLTWWTK